jgi:hypothetical protein
VAVKRRWLELVARVEEGERELESGGQRYGVLLGCHTPYIGVGGCQGDGNGR